MRSHVTLAIFLALQLSCTGTRKPRVDHSDHRTVAAAPTVKAIEPAIAPTSTLVASTTESLKNVKLETAAVRADDEIATPPKREVVTPGGTVLNVSAGKIEVVSTPAGPTTVKPTEAQAEAKPEAKADAKASAKSEIKSEPNVSSLVLYAEVRSTTPAADASTAVNSSVVAAAVAAVTPIAKVPAFELQSVTMEPDTEYTILLTMGTNVEIVEKITVTTLAETPELVKTEAPASDSTSTKLEVAINANGNPDHTDYALAVIPVGATEPVAYVDVRTGELVAKDVDPFVSAETLPEAPAEAVAVAVAVAVVRIDVEQVKLAIGSDFELAAVARNDRGVETPPSDPILSTDAQATLEAAEALADAELLQEAEGLETEPRSETSVVADAPVAELPPAAADVAPNASTVVIDLTLAEQIKLKKAEVAAARKDLEPRVVGIAVARTELKSAHDEMNALRQTLRSVEREMPRDEAKIAAAGAGFDALEKKIQGLKDGIGTRRAERVAQRQVLALKVKELRELKLLARGEEGQGAKDEGETKLAQAEAKPVQEAAKDGKAEAEAEAKAKAKADEGAAVKELAAKEKAVQDVAKPAAQAAEAKADAGAAKKPKKDAH